MDTAVPEFGKTCPKCGFAWERPGLAICPRCVLSTQFEGGEEDGACLPGESGFEGERAHLVPGYVIGEVLGRGGCGTVYKATQTVLDRPVAIKFLRQDRAVSRQGLERLQGESVSLAQLQHPHLLSVIDSGEIGGESYIVMEYASGGDLRGMMRDGPLPHEKVVSVIKEAASALSQAHSEGFVHRDIKPENLLLDRDGRVRVADFGLAASSEGSAHLGLAESFVGTPGYMAPEQRGKADAEQVDKRADIYSLGCLAYEMLTGGLPSNDPSPPSAMSGIPKAVDAPVFKAMAASPGERYETADVFAIALEDALLSRTAGPQILWAVGTGLLALVLVVVWGVAKPMRMGEPSLPLEMVSVPPKLYWSETEIAEQRDRLMQQLKAAPKPTGVSVNEIVECYDRGLDDTSASRGELVWGKEGAVRLVQRYLQSKRAEGEEAWFDREVDYLYEGVVSRERVRETLTNYQSIWPQRWQYLQESPKVTETPEGLIEVRVRYVHLALNARRLRKWTLQRCYGIKKGSNGKPVISAFLNDEVRERTPLTKAERHFLLMHFCENYYKAGCAHTDLDQINFLSDPTYYIDADRSLTEISQSFEHYYLIRPNRKLALLIMPEVERLSEDLYLAACRFEASRGEGKGSAEVTDIIQILFTDDEPHMVYVKPIN